MKDNWTQNTTTITDKIEIFYTRTGNGEKPTLILAHGITDHGLCWHQFAADLEDKYDIIMFDAYGHGKSSRVDPDKRFDLVENLHDIIESLKLNRPCVIAKFGAKYPDLLSAMVLEDPPWSDLEMSNDQKTELMAPNWEEAILEEWAQAKLLVDPTIFDHYPLKNTDWRELAKAIKVPTLIVTGDNDRGAIVTPDLGVEAVKLLEKGEFGHISAAGHCVRYEQYQPYLTMVKLFLKRNLPELTLISALIS